MPGNLTFGDLKKAEAEWNIALKQHLHDFNVAMPRGEVQRGLVVVHHDGSGPPCFKKQADTCRVAAQNQSDDAA